MDFALTADQTLMQASVSGVLERACPLERVRAFAESEEPFCHDEWTALTDLGVPGLLIDEAHGGLGLSLLDAALVAETLGAHVAPTPFLSSAVLAPLALAIAGSPAQQDALLPSLAVGDFTAGVAINEAIVGRRDGAGVSMRNGKLSGRSLFALDAASARLLIVADGGGLSLVDAGAVGLHIKPLNTIDRTRRVSEIVFDNVDAEPLPGDTKTALETMRDAAWTLLAADMLGASGAMIAKAVAYSQERRQFGRVIGSFQAVKHMCAEMTAQLEPCRALIWYAAYAAEAAPAEASLMAAHAKALLSEVSRFVARTSTEVHGGMGFTDLLGLHFWFKRVGLDRQLFGGPEKLRVEAARLQGFA